MTFCVYSSETESLDSNIELITRPYNPQTNDKIERLFRTIEEELYRYESIEEYQVLQQTSTPSLDI